MKKVARAVVVSILGWQTRRLLKRHQPKVIGVVGSIGKTSTKFAIATILKEKFTVRFQEGNYNDLVTVPLVFFGRELPSLFNPVAWATTFIKNEAAIRGDYDPEVVVVEIGTDTPGDIAEFSKYLHCDITVVTAITLEHMEFFRDLDHIAEEEFSVAKYSTALLVNTDLCEEKYLTAASEVTTFGSTKSANFQIANEKFDAGKARFDIQQDGQMWLTSHMEAVAKSELYSATAGAAVGQKLGMTGPEIIRGIAKITPVSGRMQRLNGVRGSTILDETYNASPEAVKAALDSLYAMKSRQKIAILGNMNELGDYSKDAHIEVGQYCDPNQLSLVVTIGPDANEFLAPAAVENGCLVKTFTDPYTAGTFVRDQIKTGAVILAKGSQNKVFAEEAVKPLLQNPDDAIRLVRQSQSWLKKKEKSFKK